MPIHVQLLAGLAGLILGVLVGAAGIFEVFGEDLSFPLAMGGAVAGAAGIYFLLPLIQNFPAMKQGLLRWAEGSPNAAKTTGIVCIVAGVGLILISLWAFLGSEMRRGGGKVLGIGIALGGGLDFLGYTIMQLRPQSPPDES